MGTVWSMGLGELRLARSTPHGIATTKCYDATAGYRLRISCWDQRQYGTVI